MKKLQYWLQSSRGVSDVLGYLMIFAIIITLAFIASTSGVADISQQQQTEQVQTVERGFEILDRDLETIQTHKDTRKTTPLNIQEGSIGYGEPATITIGKWDEGTNEFTTDNTSIETYPIRYQHTASNTELIYEGGLLFNDRAGRNTLSRLDTEIVLHDSKAVIPVANIDPKDSSFAMAPSGTLNVQSTFVSDTQTVDSRTVTGDTIRIEVISENPSGWERQLRDEGFENVDREGNVVRADLANDMHQPSKAVLSVSTIKVNLYG